MPWRPLSAGTFAPDLAHPGCDALLAWADGTSFQDFLRRGQPVPAQVAVVCELSDDVGAIAQLARELHDLAGGHLTEAYPRAPGHATRYCTATLTADYLAALHRGQVGRMIRRLEAQMPVIPRRPRTLPVAPGMPASMPAPAVPAGRVLLGVIDSGCPFAHHSLRRARGGTRVLALWDQDTHPALQGIGGAAPVSFGYGAQALRPQLDATIAACTDDDGCVDEAACYAKADMPWLRSRVSHGAAVLDLLTGPRPLGQRIQADAESPPRWDEPDDEASRADIVFVDLPRDAVQDSTSASLGRYLLDGLRYIVDLAGPRTERIVINLSNGTSRSTHDGSSILEQAMDALVQEQAARGRQLHIVVSAGNDHDEERHAQVDALPGDATPVPVKLFVPPGSEAPQWIWLRVPPGARDLQVMLEPPGADPHKPTPGPAADLRSSPWVGAGCSAAWWPLPGERVAAGIVFPSPMPAPASGLVLLNIQPTDHAAAAGGAVHGVWTVWIRGQVPAGTSVHLHVARNQRNPGSLHRGRQAWFIEKFERYDPLRWRREAEADPDDCGSPIRRAGSLNGLATGTPGRGVVVVGSVSQREGRPARYSSAGPAAGGTRPGPDVAAVTDLHRCLPGVVCAGTRSGDAVRMVGTSFASPQVARYIANHGVLPPPGCQPDPRRTGCGGGYV